MRIESGERPLVRDDFLDGGFGADEGFAAFGGIGWAGHWSRRRLTGRRAAALVGSARGCGDAARVDEIAGELGGRDPELRPQSALHGAVILRAAEDVANQAAKRGRIIEQLDHARRDRAAEKRSAENARSDVRGEFKVSGESGTEA